MSLLRKKIKDDFETGSRSPTSRQAAFQLFVYVNHREPIWFIILEISPEVSPKQRYYRRAIVPESKDMNAIRPIHDPNHNKSDVATLKRETSPRISALMTLETHSRSIGGQVQSNFTISIERISVEPHESCLIDGSRHYVVLRSRYKRLIRHRSDGTWNE